MIYRIFHSISINGVNLLLYKVCCIFSGEIVWKEKPFPFLGLFQASLFLKAVTWSKCSAHQSSDMLDEAKSQTQKLVLLGLHLGLFFPAHLSCSCSFSFYYHSCSCCIIHQCIWWTLFRFCRKWGEVLQSRCHVWQVYLWGYAEKVRDDGCESLPDKQVHVSFVGNRSYYVCQNADWLCTV